MSAGVCRDGDALLFPARSAKLSWRVARGHSHGVQGTGLGPSGTFYDSPFGRELRIPTPANISRKAKPFPPTEARPLPCAPQSWDEDWGFLHRSLPTAKPTAPPSTLPCLLWGGTRTACLCVGRGGGCLLLQCATQRTCAPHCEDTRPNPTGQKGGKGQGRSGHSAPALQGRSRL